MKIEDIRVLAQKTREPILAKQGFESVDVSPHVDWTGEDALRVLVRLRVGRRAILGDVSIDAMMALSHALLNEGDERFPYLSFDSPSKSSRRMIKKDV